jgi:hypothetical protein
MYASWTNLILEEMLKKSTDCHTLSDETESFISLMTCLRFDEGQTIKTREKKLLKQE